ncbi:cupin-like domain-containing protein [Serratia liquefaciens]|uniref:cupin-like domain-containing protein n=1 Tax=Serratia liquefaciens TaxID=614 RepID=UPI00191C6595|nr:cupin-like domain-containing protein [Serratia liquefaciens]CAI0744965.1 Cupin superfamily protein [Serratia liquefaciens]CAI0972990.1 Cupin superfamily protein [Serratia liquefaciens]CAI1571033.1 Cupin superfamily protein [Serratia liquefaciens]CAI1591267.1 Cupin superfamily protein [Serratia liquefaciens]CAI2052907.1 Cupin superfamily protein [Serratia liquefaciens]
MKQLTTGVPVPRMTFKEFVAFGVEAIFRADVPVIITDLPIDTSIGASDLISQRLGDDNVTLFREASNKENTERWQTMKIQLRGFLENKEYQSDNNTWYRVVSNIMHRPEDVNNILGFDAFSLLASRRGLNAANLWVSYHGVFTQSHFDELENFNISLQGRKRFILFPPGRGDYYPRSILQGFGDKSQAFDFDNIDPQRFPRLAAKIPQRRDFILEPGEMLYLPLGWWHQAESLDDLNINVNFWLWDLKILRRPYVFYSALYTAAYRKFKGIYNYQPEPTKRKALDEQP